MLNRNKAERAALGGTTTAKWLPTCKDAEIVSLGPVQIRRLVALDAR
jgi:hypothetical protein